MMTLPIDAHLNRIVEALSNHRAVILQAPTGTGKTTRVPLAILKAGLAGEGKILVLQPRRVAARATAKMMAQNCGQALGETVGYHIRFDRKAGRQTRILVITEGMLNRRLLADPLLEDVSCVILDEFHQRSLHTDLALAFVRELWTLREDLKLMVMSATLDLGPLSRYLEHCPVIEVEVPAHPLAIQYCDTDSAANLGEAVSLGLKSLFAADDDGGNILVFLPGVGEIRQVMRDLEKQNWPAEIIALHGSLSAELQDLALRNDGPRRIILATNIAETSLTIPGVSAVIDSGFQKIIHHDAGKGIDRLDLCRISKASATQRAGRAGRLGPGRVVRLWSKQRHVLLAEHEAPEIQRVDLASMLLGVLDFHGPDIDAFPFFDKPPNQAINRALTLLRDLVAIDDQGRITAQGRQLCRLPLSPRLGAILIASAELGCLDAGTTWCALLSERPKVQGAVLFEDLWMAFERESQGHGGHQWRPVLAVKRQLQKLAKRQWPESRVSHRQPRAMLETCLLAGFSDRLCRRRQAGMGVMVGGRGVGFDGRSLENRYDLFLALDLSERGQSRTAAKVDLIQPVALDQVTMALPTQWVTSYPFDEESQGIRPVQHCLFRDLPLAEKATSAIDKARMAQALAAAAAQHFDRFFQLDAKAEMLLFRLRLAQQYLNEAPWPDVSEQGLKQMLPEICYGHRNFSSLSRINWHRLLWNQLDWQQQALLDRELPLRWPVPSGSEPKIDYSHAFQATGVPVLAVRLQECFGMAETPRIARGRLPLLLHLLAPNMRPVQVTQDLVNFWNTTYQEVRKELRQRYPKHAWPENPWQAKAIRGVARRKRS